MKMTDGLYKDFEEAIKGSISYVGEENTRRYRKHVDYTDNQFEAFIMGVYQFTNRNNNYRLSENAYASGLEDSHIKTALRKILKEYK